MACIVKADVVVTAGPVGGVPVAVPVLEIDPASTSVCVVVWGHGIGEPEALRMLQEKPVSRMMTEPASPVWGERKQPFTVPASGGGAGSGKP